MTKKTWVKIAAWGQLAIVYINQALSASGGLIPQTRSQWSALAGSLLVALAGHFGSETSAGHPNGAQSGFIKLENFVAIWFLFLCVNLCLIVSGCSQPIEQTGRDGIAAAKGFITSAAQKHSAECIQSGGKAQYCDTIIKAAFAENAAIDALETYCQLPAHTLPPQGQDMNCVPLASAKQALVAALGNLNAISGDLKAAAQ